MLQNVDQFYGVKLGAADGDIGHVKDFYFDDNTWAVRYLVADTGSWLSGRQVLLPPRAFESPAFGGVNVDVNMLHVNLTRKQIEDSPSIDSHRPVSRQYEEEYYRYYGWPAYWQDGGMYGAGTGFPVVTPPLTAENQPHHGHNQRDDIHLRSMKELVGYNLQATDGPIGSVCSFMVHGESWAVRELVIETGHWYEGKKILLLTKNIDRISYEASTIFVNLTLEDIEQTVNNGVAHAGAGSVKPGAAQTA